MKILKSRLAALAELKKGSIGVVPTDTIYGVVALASSQAAVKRLYELKQRHKKPGTIIAASLDQLVELGIPRRYLTAVADYWPNPLSVVVPVPPGLAYLDQSVGTLAVRVPADAALRDFLQQTGPLLTSSANHPAEPTAATIEKAEDYFGDAVDFYVDGGDLSGRPPSTVIRVVDDAVVVLRRGAVNINEVGEII